MMLHDMGTLIIHTQSCSPHHIICIVTCHWVLSHIFSGVSLWHSPVTVSQYAKKDLKRSTNVVWKYLLDLCSIT